MRVGRPFGGDAGFGFQPAFLQHPLQGGVERAFLHPQQVIGDLLDVLHQRIAVHGPVANRLQNHDFEGAGEEITARRSLQHGRDFIPRIPILKIGMLGKFGYSPASRKNDNSTGAERILNHPCATGGSGQQRGLWQVTCAKSKPAYGAIARTPDVNFENSPCPDGRRL